MRNRESVIELEALASLVLLLLPPLGRHLLRGLSGLLGGAHVTNIVIGPLRLKSLPKVSPRDTHVVKAGIQLQS